MAQEQKIELKEKQDKFVFSPKRYPAFVAGWACGKSLCLILRALVYSETIPNNLGVIFRKEFTDLRDSTIKDFERYTGMKVDSQRSVTFENGSQIMFRHIEEINNIQNINLGWFGIEQGDELETDSEFFFLFGRLRREIEETETFKGYGLPARTGFVIANAGDHWMRPLWLEGNLGDSELVQMRTQENADVLPDDFLNSLEELKKNKPEVYERYVENSWDVTDDTFRVFKTEDIEGLKGIHRVKPYPKRFLVLDPAAGGDEAVLLTFEDSVVTDMGVYHLNDTMKLAGEAMVQYRKSHAMEIYVDTVGLGKPIADRLTELGAKVRYVNSAEKSREPHRYINLRAEIYDTAGMAVVDKKVEYPGDDELRKQLKAIRYEIATGGKYKIEPKQKIKERIGASPDRADAWVIGIWAYIVHGKRIEGRKIPETMRTQQTEYAII